MGRNTKKVTPVLKEQRNKLTAMKFASDAEYAIAPPDNVDAHVWKRQLHATFGTHDIDTMYLFLQQIIGIINPSEKNHAEALNRATPLLRSINPSDELEGMLALQMIGIHTMAMEMMGRAMQTDQTVNGVNDNVNRVTKLTRTFIAQMAALNKHRGKGQQKMTVEHVHVNEGGQAVIGDVKQGGCNNEK